MYKVHITALRGDLGYAQPPTHPALLSRDTQNCRCRGDSIAGSLFKDILVEFNKKGKKNNLSFMAEKNECGEGTGRETKVKRIIIGNRRQFCTTPPVGILLGLRSKSLGWILAS